MSMTQQDRELMMKIAKKVDKVTKDVKVIFDVLNQKQDKKVSLPVSHDPVNQVKVGIHKDGDPYCMIIGEFMLNGSTPESQQQAHDALRKMITEFCRGYNIIDLQIHFKENKK